MKEHIMEETELTILTAYFHNLFMDNLIILNNLFMDSLITLIDNNLFMLVKATQIFQKAIELNKLIINI